MERFLLPTDLVTLGKSLDLAELQLIIAIIPGSQVSVRIKGKCWVEPLRGRRTLCKR